MKPFQQAIPNMSSTMACWCPGLPGFMIPEVYTPAIGGYNNYLNNCNTSHFEWETHETEFNIIGIYRVNNQQDAFFLGSSREIWPNYGHLKGKYWSNVRWKGVDVFSTSKYKNGSRKRFIASRKRFHEQRLSKSGESWTRKTKASWNCQCMQFITKKPIFAFFIELKKQLQLF